MGLSDVIKAVIPFKDEEKNIPARSFGWRSLALALSSCMQVTWPKSRVPALCDGRQSASPGVATTA